MAIFLTVNYFPLHRASTTVPLRRKLRFNRGVEIVKLTNRQQFSVVCTLIDNRNDVKMVKTLEEPRTAGEWFHCKLSRISQN